jgi:hypothetical protein
MNFYNDKQGKDEGVFCFSRHPVVRLTLNPCGLSEIVWI